MDFLAHRGVWTEPAEQNGLDACKEAWRAGFGIETDIRDRLGGIVVSHDPAPDGDLITLEVLLAEHAALGSSTPLALNVKACGLAVPTAKRLAEHGTVGAFVFDLAVPDALGWLAAGIDVFTRHSDIEPDPVLYERCTGVWLDSFGPEWWTPEIIAHHIEAGKQVAIVSPELHGRPYLAVWESLAASGVHQAPGIFLCTDYPQAAQEWFS
jgi:hypothetical protein